MAVLQPLYFAGGRYTASIDRKLLAALIDPEKTGKRIAGVIPPSPSMLVSGSTTSSIAVAPGFCVIPDSDSPSAASPGLYLCAIDSSSETLPALPAQTTGSRIDLIYASVSETSFTITSKSLTSNKATIHTSANHGFSAGQTVVISGVDEIFDGSYVILGAGVGEEADVPTDKTFKYERTFNSNVADTYVTPVVRRATSTTEVVVTGTAIPSTNQVTFTTATTDLYVAGETVTVIGVSNELDGTYRVLAGTGGTVPSVTSFTVAKISSITPSVYATLTKSSNNHSNGVTEMPLSSVAKARVPFAIKRAQGTAGTTPVAPSLPAGRNLELARLTVTGTSVTRQDVRQFTAGTGGIRLYNSSAPGTDYDPDGSIGGARYDTHTNRFEVYSTEGVEKWYPIFYGTTKHHDAVATNGSNAALHHTIGTGQFNAARGDHIHGISSTRLGLNASIDTASSIINAELRRVTSKASATPTLLTQTTAMNIPANSVVLVIATASVSISATGTKCNFGIKLNTGTIQRTAALGVGVGIFSVTSIRRYVFNSATNNVIFQFAGYQDSTADSNDVYNVFDADMIVIPFSNIITNSLSAPS
jgi:hypothetical protein